MSLSVMQELFCVAKSSLVNLKKGRHGKLELTQKGRVYLQSVMQ